MTLLRDGQEKGAHDIDYALLERDLVRKVNEQPCRTRCTCICLDRYIDQDPARKLNKLDALESDGPPRNADQKDWDWMKGITNCNTWSTGDHSSKDCSEKYSSNVLYT